ncbi:hypothetical protein RchiOBHm_Chr3g0462951 [Rosa chinensis]|uniref:Uncharacterized protein n=1 Tax=Rosa chinensis TaxID=74649 RepID=A0A2P6R915_ROSCH|nr:hypothetical protein RchiOBHm_Chr3g0462951 [Rosa chinensis]
MCKIDLLVHFHFSTPMYLHLCSPWCSQAPLSIYDTFPFFSIIYR